MNRELNYDDPDYKRIMLYVPKTAPDPNWIGWDLESFYLGEHLHELIKSYGLEIIKNQLKECELLLNKIKENADNRDNNV